MKAKINLKLVFIISYFEMTSPQLLKHLLIAFSLLIVPSSTTKVDYSG